MPFPWKKAKVTRISRLVADLHQSPKHGGSLVVETGFPTSLIDLFVKNRDRLRKSSKRKSSPVIETLATHLPSSAPKPIPSPPDNEDLQSPQVDVGKLVLVKKEREERIAFQTAFKIFLVVALAVSTRNLALWIMMAAFLLVLIEFVGANFFGFLRPESETLFLDSWIGKGLSVLKKWVWEQASLAEESVVKQQRSAFPDSCELMELEADCVEESQLAESKIACVGTQIKVEESETRLIGKSERSRSARFKRNFIKKLVPKKLRHGKKQGKSNNKDEIEEEKQGLELDGDGEEESFKGLEDSDQPKWVELEMEAVKDKMENIRKGKSGYLILIVIVLAGLVGGRGVALLFTLVCCLILRYVGRLRRC